MALPKGSLLINRYKISKLIKKGGMGVVYLAEDLHLERKCAVKELMLNSRNKTKAEMDTAIGSFKREAKILADLHHTNLPKVYDYFVVKNKYFLVMDYIKGNDLLSILNEGNIENFSEEETVKWLSQLCDVLDYLHGHDPPIIYRDLKPSNIMLRKKDKKVILIDFGIAIISGGSLPFKEDSLGTLGYVSPEQCEGKATPRSDIYSLGATVYHLLTGFPPPLFIESSVREKRPDISNELDKIISTCLKIEPDKRYADVKSMYKALQDYKEQEKTYSKEISSGKKTKEKDNKQGYSLKEKSLYHILYKYYREGKSGKIILKDKKESGEIYFNRGNIVNAKLADLEGEEALNSFFVWTEGSVTYSAEISNTIKIKKSSSTLIKNCLNISNQIKEIKKDLFFMNLDSGLSIKTLLPVEEKYKFSPLEIAIIAYIKNGLSIREIGKKIGKSYLRIIQSLYRLYDENLIIILPSIPEEEIKVLIADDESSLRRMIKSFLEENYKFQVETASDGIECCIKINIFKPHIIILDICMPDMSGWEVCNAIKKLPDYSRPETIIITAVKTNLLEELVEMDFVDILYKPFTVTSLENKVNKAIKKIIKRLVVSYK